VIGLTLGGVAAWGLSRALASVVSDVTAGEPLVWGGVGGIIAVTTIAACWRCLG
jgi:hypothetical protein